jgi:all-trans-8'-apo-beta-carotenal 15,15'-oxygenase
MCAGGAFGFYHDMVVTDNHYILVQNPVRMDVAKLVTEYVTAKCGIAQCLKYDPTQPTRIHVVQRHTKSPKVQTMLTVPSFTFHHVNAFEVDGGSRIIFDSLPWRSVDFSSNLDTLGVRASST